MIYYLILILAVVCFTAQFGFTRCFEKAIKPALSTTLVMIVVTNLVGVVLFLVVGGFRVHFSLVSVLWAVAFAAVMIPYFVAGVKVLSLGSLAVYSMFMMLGGMLVPFFYGVLFLKETLTAGRVLGTVLLSFCIILQTFLQNNADKQTNRGKKYLFFALCIIIFFINGMTGVIAKVHATSSHAVDEISFLVLSCSFTALIGLILLTFGGKNTLQALKTTFKVRPILIMALLGASAYVGNFLHLKAAAYVPASVQFPLVSGGVIVLSALASRLIFKEIISKKEWLSVGGAFISTLLFAF